MPQRTTWVLVANSTTAKVFEHSGSGAGLNALPDLMFEAAPVYAPNVIDAAGEAPDNGSGPEPLEARASDFLKAIAQKLDEELRRKAFDELIIVVPPGALGEIRPHLSKSLQTAVVQDVAKDLTGLATPDLERHLETVLPA